MSQRRTAARIQSAATTNSTLVKTGNTVALCGMVGNNGAGNAYIKFYNKATAPTVGTDVPFATFLIPPSRNVEIELDYGFSLGLGYAITGAAADNDTTAVLVNQVTGVFFHD